MTVEVFDSVWDAVEESPEGSLNMRFRSDLMMRIGRCISEWGVSQKQAAHRLAITQARLSDLLEGRINQFSLEELLKIAETADIKVEITSNERLSQHIGLSFPYDWSNRQMEPDLLIAKVLERGIFRDIALVSIYYGIERVRVVAATMPPEVQSRHRFWRSLDNIEKGVKHAS